MNEVPAKKGPPALKPFQQLPNKNPASDSTKAETKTK
jgi:hypothetical protein